MILAVFRREHSGACWPGVGGRLLGTVVAATLVGCGAPSPISQAGPALPSSFSGAGTEVVPDQWWRSFGDGQLNRVEKQALDGNFSLSAAWQRLQQAKAIAARERSGLFPDLDGVGEASARRGSSAAGSLGESLDLGLAASYEVDLWGRIRATADAEALRARASLADYRAAALTLSAEVATTWYLLVEAWAQRDLVDEQIETNGKVLRQLKVRLGEGQGGAVDILRQEQLVRATREQKAVVESDIGVLENRLAVLQGRAPAGTVSATRQSLPSLPPLPRTGVPLQLVQRRPDVLRAYYEIRAADADLAAAITAQYPRVNLTAGLTTSGGGSADLFEDWLAAVAGGVVAPVLDGGERKAEVQRARASRDELVADYGQAVLEAIREVEDALVRERKQRERIAEIDRQLELARRSYQQLLMEYFNGVSNYIDVLTALTDQQELQRDRLTARRTLMVFRIGLYRALAGSLPRDLTP